ncbi:EAL domain, c-di-GMP-specific phosphodiesterase class I (or its enzymatically inactive variant) [Ferrimonas marina]|uniref:EAL domain, c-di-GMP-specific phosphodiesterase class I (Or its enzymatically inactive variant) n=1 Tax=Ferrimonas marina TaxID=299255 RepID=A0A1M5RJ85_9GAMM|nr:EAL domain, c-di-GMP-specific phosphodiesterase class I (or its enzymatically inactive variant) [Ferrimonas marina]
MLVTALLTLGDLYHRVDSELEANLLQIREFAQRIQGTAQRWPERFERCDEALKGLLYDRAKLSSLASSYAYHSRRFGWCYPQQELPFSDATLATLIRSPLTPNINLTSDSTLLGRRYIYSVDLGQGDFLVGQSFEKTLKDQMSMRIGSNLVGTRRLFLGDEPPLVFQSQVELMPYLQRQQGEMLVQLALAKPVLYGYLFHWSLWPMLVMGSVSVGLPIWWRRRQSQQGIHPSDIEQSYARREIFPVYQPIVDGRNGLIHGYEQLARWRHPKEGMIPPNLFIPLLMRHNRLDQLLDYLVGHSRPKLKGGQYLSINITGSQLRRDPSLAWLAKCLLKQGLLPHQILLEISEQQPLNDCALLDSLRNLQRQGYRIALDDFGTGHNDLGVLGLFRPDIIKIDRSYVEAIGGDSMRVVVLEQMLNLARTSGIPHIAEGVETEAQRQYLLSKGITRMQGFLFARPSTVAELESEYQLALEPLGLAPADGGQSALG